MAAKGDLLYELLEFMRERSYIVGDETSIRDMVLRYQNPPLTLRRKVAMQMTVDEYNHLNQLLERIDKVVEKERHDVDNSHAKPRGGRATDRDDS